MAIVEGRSSKAPGPNIGELFRFTFLEEVSQRPVPLLDRFYSF